MADILKTTNTIFGSVAFVLIFLVGLSLLVKWNWNLLFMAITSILAGSYLIIESKYKNIRSLVKKTSFKGRNLLHTFSFAIGLVTVIFGVLLLPAYLGRMLQIEQLFGTFFLINGIFIIAEKIEDYI